MGSQENILAHIEKRVVLLDGGMGTMLMAEGLQGGDPPEGWNLQNPEAVQSIHKSYYAAGADVVLTNTFGANRFKLRRKKLEGETYRLNIRGAELARGVRPPGRFVAGDIGPSGELVAPVGNVTAEELEEVFAEQAEALVSGGVDFLVIETMFSLQEALAALKGVRRASRVPVFVSMTYEKKDRGFFTMMGETPEVCARALEEEGVDGHGANCTLGSREMLALAKVLRETTGLPVLVQPNAGKPLFRKGRTVYEQAPEDFAKDIEAMVEQGVRLVGGCCGTTPEFISAVRHRLFDG